MFFFLETAQISQRKAACLIFFPQKSQHSMRWSRIWTFHHSTIKKKQNNYRQIKHNKHLITAWLDANCPTACAAANSVLLFPLFIALYKNRTYILNSPCTYSTLKSKKAPSLILKCIFKYPNLAIVVKGFHLLI